MHKVDSSMRSLLLCLAAGVSTEQGAGVGLHTWVYGTEKLLMYQPCVECCWPAITDKDLLCKQNASECM